MKCVYKKIKKKRRKEKMCLYIEKNVARKKICVITGQHFTLLRGNTEIEHTEKP